MEVINKRWREEATKVTLFPKCKRAKERVARHGNIMLLLRQDPDGRFLVESIGNTWRDQKWMGWFYLWEADFKTLDGETAITNPS